MAYRAWPAFLKSFYAPRSSCIELTAPSVSAASAAAGAAGPDPFSSQQLAAAAAAAQQGQLEAPAPAGPGNVQLAPQPQQLPAAAATSGGSGASKGGCMGVWGLCAGWGCMPKANWRWRRAHKVLTPPCLDSLGSLNSREGVCSPMHAADPCPAAPLSRLSRCPAAPCSPPTGSRLALSGALAAPSPPSSTRSGDGGGSKGTPGVSSRGGGRAPASRKRQRA